MVVERGMVTLAEHDSEVQVREKIVSSLKEKYNIIGPNDFEFVKVTQKKISVLHLGKQAEYNYDVVKKLVGQGLLYLRMRLAKFSLTRKCASKTHCLAEKWKRDAKRQGKRVLSDAHGLGW